MISNTRIQPRITNLERRSTLGAGTNSESPQPSLSTSSPALQTTPQTSLSSRARARGDTGSNYRAFLLQAPFNHSNTEPGFTPAAVEAGPNNFTLGIQGPDPMLVVGGSPEEQERQRDYLLAFAVRALLSYMTRHTPGAERWPSDADVQTTLAGLNRNPPIGTDGQEVTHAIYQSTIPNTTPDQAYDHFVNNPEEVFGAGGMEIRPATDQLVDGGRYMLEISAPVPMWLPVEIELDPETNSITIHTMDGHVLRGVQTFTFTQDQNGNTVLTQDARFQASTPLAGDLQQISGIAAGQHLAWQHAHREIFEQFNGDPNYKGIGTDAFNLAQLDSWREALGNIVQDPGNAVDTGFDVAGELANEVFDGTGALAAGILDELGIPGSGVVLFVTDFGGDMVSKGADKAGDVIEDAIDWANPF